MTQEEKYNLLKEACEEALKSNPELLEGRQLVFSERSGEPWKVDIFAEFKKGHKNEFKIYIAYVDGIIFRILITKNKAAAEKIEGKLKENIENIIVTLYPMRDTVGICGIFNA